MSTAILANRASVCNDLISVGEAGSLVGMSGSSIRLLCNEGKLSCYRTPAGHRRVARREVLEYYGVADATSDSTTEGISVNGNVRAIGYSRISSRGSSKSVVVNGKEEIGQLARQVEDIQRYAKEQLGINDLVVLKEVASGVALNEKTRPKFAEVVRLITTGKITHLLITHRERLARLGMELIYMLCDIHGVKIVETNKEDSLTADEQAVDFQLIADLFFSFQIKTYSKRAAAKRKVRLTAATLERIKELEDSHTVEEITRILRTENHTAEYPEGKRITYAVVRRLVRQQYKLQSHKERFSQNENHIHNFISTQLIKEDNERLRIRSADVYESYLEFCEKHELAAATKQAFSKQIAAAGFQLVCWNNGEGIQRAIVGVKIRSREHLSVEIRSWNKKSA